MHIRTVGESPPPLLPPPVVICNITNRRSVPTLYYQHAPVPLIDTQTGAIEVGHTVTVRRRSSRILLKRSFALPV